MQVEQYFKDRKQLEVRKYQVDVITDTLSDLTSDYNSVLVESPTGSGKTIMGLSAADMLCQHLEGKTIGWVAMRKNLLAQTVEEQKLVETKSKLVPFSMFDKNPPKVDVLVVDEAHHDATASMAAIHKKVQPKKVLGLTATPMRADRANLIFEKSISKAGIYELIRLGYLAKPEQYIIPDWAIESVTDCFLSSPEKWGQSIMYFFTMDECTRAHQILIENGITAEIVNATSDREMQLNAFEQGECQVLINMAILTEGFNCPRLQTAFVRPTNKSLTLQMSGRVLRIKDSLRKKIIQPQNSKYPFQSLAPVACSYKLSDDSQWKNLSYDEEFVNYLIENSNKSLELLEKRKDQHNELAIRAFKDYNK